MGAAWVVALATAGCDQTPEQHREVVGDRDVDRGEDNEACPSACETVGGDVNGDGAVDIADMIVLVAHFEDGTPACELAADVNGDGGFDIADIVYFENWMWSGGPDPVAPVPPGDVNADGDVNIADMQLLPQVLFGPPPKVEICEHAADVNGDCDSNIADLQYLSEFLWDGGADPIACGS